MHIINLAHIINKLLSRIFLLSLLNKTQKDGLSIYYPIQLWFERNGYQHERNGYQHERVFLVLYLKKELTPCAARNPFSLKGDSCIELGS